MIDWPHLIGALGVPALLAIIAAAILWDRRRARRTRKPVPDGPPGEAYRVYTRAHDLELQARDIPAALRDASLDFFRGWTDQNGEVWERNQALARAFAGSQPSAEGFTRALAAQFGHSGIAPRDAAITLLIDQSGSMRGQPIAATAAAIATLSKALGELGARHEILGFSTAGWHGGRVREEWLRKGRPKRPGRLCALLHIVYKTFEEPEWSTQSQAAFTHPDILRENVDGEALDWAAGRLNATEALHRLLLVLSDGAPVDDSTLLANGEQYLVRELRRSIARADNAIALGAIEIGDEQWVADCYPRQRSAGLETLADTLVETLGDALSRAREIAAAH